VRIILLVWESIAPPQQKKLGKYCTRHLQP